MIGLALEMVGEMTRHRKLGLSGHLLGGFSQQDNFNMFPDKNMPL
jgi:hypothetical protein